MVPIDLLGLGNIGATEPVPQADQAFIDYANSRGWKVGAEWSPEHEDEDGEIYPACWFVSIYRTGPCGDDDICYCAVDVHEHAYARGNEELWRLLLNLADGEWERICERAASSSGASA